MGLVCQACCLDGQAKSLDDGVRQGPQVEVGMMVVVPFRSLAKTDAWLVGWE